MYWRSTWSSGTRHRWRRRDRCPGSFAAIATLLGSPLVGAFLLMEMAGLGGPMMEIVLVPGLLAAGVGSLIFVGLDSLTGFGTFSLTVSSIPHVGSPTGSEFLWAVVIGLGAAVAATEYSGGHHAPAPGRTQQDPLDPGRGLGGWRSGDRLRRGDRSKFLRGAVLRSKSRCRLSSSRQQDGPSGAVLLLVCKGLGLFDLAEQRSEAAPSFRACSSARPAASPCPT